jgi:hypothetical protein
MGIIKIIIAARTLQDATCSMDAENVKNILVNSQIVRGHLGHVIYMSPKINCGKWFWAWSCG